MAQLREMDYAHTQDVKQLNGRMSAPERKGRDVRDRSPRAPLFYYLSYLDPLKGFKACSPKCQALYRSKAGQEQEQAREQQQISHSFHSSLG